MRSCYKQKFGIPRQSGLAVSNESIIELIAPYDHEDYVRELQGFSHIWLVFIFHQHIDKEIKATVRPPRLGGNKRVGVFASRSPFRPSPVGLSVVKLIKVEKLKNKIQLVVTGADLLDGTPVIDIKPYIKYADSIQDSYSSYAEIQPEAVLRVVFSDEAKSLIDNITDELPQLATLIRETISLDPRPAYTDDDTRIYGLCLYDFNIKWRVEGDLAKIITIEDLR